MALKYHPDKNPNNPEATQKVAVFQLLPTPYQPFTSDNTKLHYPLCNHTSPSHATLCHTISCNTSPHHLMQHHTTSHHTTQHHTTPLHPTTPPHHTTPHHTISPHYTILPHHIISPHHTTTPSLVPGDQQSQRRPLEPHQA